MQKIGVFVPCYNEDDRIRKFLLNFDEELFERVDQVLVVNNASTDETLDILKSVKSESHPVSSQLKIINTKKNYDIGGSHKIAFNYFMENEFTHFLCLPSSYKGHPGKLASRFLNELDRNSEVDVIFAGRSTKDMEKQLPLEVVDKLNKKLTKQLEYLLSEFRFSDIGSRFSLIRTEILKDIPFKSLTDSTAFNLQFNILLQESTNFQMKEIELKTWVNSRATTRNQAKHLGQLAKTLYRFSINKHVLRKSGWRLFSDYPENINREFELFE